MLLKRLNYWIESKRVHKGPHWKLLVLSKDMLYLPVHYLCMLKPFRAYFFKYFGTTGKYDPRVRGIVSHKYKFIYFYIPKVASTTLKKDLAKTLFHRDINERVHMFCFDEVIDIQSGEYEDYFKFALVRNPWDRLLSCYSDKILHTNVTNDEFKNGVFRRYVRRYKDLFYMGMPFDEFIRVISNIPDEKAERHFRSQYVYITDKNDNILVDFIGKFENISSDLSFISKKTQIANFSHFHENRSNRPEDYKEIYTEETKEIVAKRYKKDIQMFGYEF